VPELWGEREDGGTVGFSWSDLCEGDTWHSRHPSPSSGPAGVTSHEYVLPAIQREFVWKPEQICAFFDSLMRRYPIGSFLFWEIPAADLGDYVFYDFIRSYHEQRGSHCPLVRTDELPANKPVTAILDGQQRMTALNIGLRGSYARRLPRKWWNNPDAYPERRLYLNIAAAAEDNDQKLAYDFRFMTEKEVKDANKEGVAHWFLGPEDPRNSPTALLRSGSSPTSRSGGWPPTTSSHSRRWTAFGSWSSKTVWSATTQWRIESWTTFSISSSGSTAAAPCCRTRTCC